MKTTISWGLFAIVLFVLVFFVSFILHRLTKELNSEIQMAKYKAKRGPVEEAPPLPAKEDVVPGYSMITKDEYEKIYRDVLEAAQKTNGDS